MRKVRTLKDMQNTPSSAVSPFPPYCLHYFFLCGKKTHEQPNQLTKKYKMDEVI